jgi:TM2 domain-containing membrane protein YozV
MMAQRVEAVKKSAESKAGRLGYMALIAGWLVPGAGHLMLKRWGRGLLVLASISCMFVLGIMMGARLYAPNAADLLDMLGFLGDLGAGMLYLVGHAMGLGQAPVQVVTADYGAKFVVVAGLLNLIAAVDAHSIAIGRKP